MGLFLEHLQFANAPSVAAVADHVIPPFATDVP